LNRTYQIKGFGPPTGGVPAEAHEAIDAAWKRWFPNDKHGDPDLSQVS